MSDIYFCIGIALPSFGAYTVIFPIVYPMAGPATAALAVLPIAITSWFLGLRGSLLFGILNVPLTTSLFYMVGDLRSATNPVAAVFASFAFTLIGISISWVRKLVHQVDGQAEELREERKVLREEINKRMLAEERLLHEALHDPLTNLPNRRLFFDRLEHAIEWNKRSPDNLVAVIYLDFDRFKVINDSMGHNTGDQLLIGLARRLKSSVRTMDTVARMGGDEFAILLEVVKSDDEVIAIVKRLQKSLAVLFEVDGNSIAMTASIGIVVNLLRYERMEDILRDADIAMYSAKVSGKNNFKVFDIAMRQEVESILKLESDLRNGLRNEEFRIHYQPIFSLKTQQIAGFEALIRWEHPERGLLYPADFMTAAEESGLIIPVGQWVLKEALPPAKTLAIPI